MIIKINLILTIFRFLKCKNSIIIITKNNMTAITSKIVFKLTVNVDFLGLDSYNFL